MVKEKIKINTIININMCNESYLQLDTNKGTFLIHNEKESNEFLKKYEVVA